MPVSQIVDANDQVTQFITLAGEARIMGQTVIDISRPGVNGHAFRKGGYRAQPFEMRGTVDVVDYPAADALLVTLRELRAQFVTVYDDFGNAFHQVIVLDVEKIRTSPALAHCGGVSGVTGNTPVAVATYRLTMLHTLVPAGA